MNENFKTILTGRINEDGFARCTFADCKGSEALSVLFTATRLFAKAMEVSVEEVAEMIVQADADNPQGPTLII